MTTRTHISISHAVMTFDDVNHTASVAFDVINSESVDADYSVVTRRKSTDHYTMKIDSSPDVIVFKLSDQQAGIDRIKNYTGMSDGSVCGAVLGEFMVLNNITPVLLSASIAIGELITSGNFVTRSNGASTYMETSTSPEFPSYLTVGQFDAMLLMLPMLRLAFTRAQ